MAIEPDTKDWTWVLQKPCPECGFDTRGFPREQVGAMTRANAEEWTSLLADPRASRRPSDDRWSALEYGCHVRDVFNLYDQRLRMMLEQDGPHYPNWDQNVSAIENDYANDDPAKVSGEIHAAATSLADRFDAVEPDQWSRAGFRSDGAEFTIETFARYFIHDPIHHVHDAERGYEQLDQR
jgi:hypothetical protein